MDLKEAFAAINRLEAAKIIDRWAVGGEVPVRVLPVEHLAAIALETGRAKDKVRVQLFLQSGKLDRERFLELVTRHGLDSKWQSFEQHFLGASE